MRLSKTTRQAIYAAIHGVTMDTRIALNREGASDKIDLMVHDMTERIFRHVLTAMGATDGR